MRAVPENLSADGALEIFVEPAIGARRDAVADLFLGDFDQFAAATHAARVAAGIGFRKIQFGADEAKLFLDGKCRRNPDRVDMAMGYEAAIKKKAVGGDDAGVEVLGFGDEIRIGDVLGPERFAAGRAQPAGKAAQSGVANDPATIGRLIIGVGNGSVVKATDLIEKRDEEFCLRVAERRRAGIDRRRGARLEPRQRFGSVASAEFGEEFVVSAFECTLDAAHDGVRYQWTQKNASPARLA